MAKCGTLENFIEKAKQIHGDKYDYSKVEYVNSQTKVCIICPIHGEFWQTPSNHTSCNNKRGCPKCNGGVKYTVNEFIKKAISIHGDKYDYSKVDYINNRTKVCIICPIHGEFWQTPSNHTSCNNKRGCPKCNGGVKFSQREFIEKSQEIHSNKYDYSKVKYINANTKVCIICPIHGEFWQQASAHMYGSGCPQCQTNYKLTTEKFIEKAKQIHGDKYDYSLVEYTNTSNYIIIVCPIHGVFKQTPNSHLQGHGCPKCHTSQLELTLINFFHENKICYEHQKRFAWLGRQSLDFYLPQHNVAIECQGIQHFECVDIFGGERNLKFVQLKDKIKNNVCNKNGIKILYFSNLKIKFPYNVITNINDLYLEITNMNARIINQIQTQIELYLTKCNIKSLIIGVSGGLDSGLNCAILKPVCDKLNIPLIGRYIHIESNKEEEKLRAIKIGKMFCHNFTTVDLTKMYQLTLPLFEEEDEGLFNCFMKDLSYDDKIRYGNIKARLRMIYLYNLAQKYKGIVIDNDNQTEHLLGFWTINGDVGDITPLFKLFKTEVYELAKYFVTTLPTEQERDALQSVIDAVPTDGLGITSSDVEQFGVDSYSEVDEILQAYLNGYPHNKVVKETIENKYSQETINKIIERHVRSDFKRHHPHRIILTLDREKWWNK